MFEQRFVHTGFVMTMLGIIVVLCLIDGLVASLDSYDDNSIMISHFYRIL